MTIKKRIRSAGNRLLAKRGLEITHRRLERSPLDQLMLALRYFEVDLVIDVGANVGQYAAEVLEAGYSGEILSIEPLPDAHRSLCEAAKRESRWHVLPRMAMGDRNRDVELQIAGNSLSSSVLPMLDRHIQAAPLSAPVGRVAVQQRTLDAVVLDRITNSRATLIKIDTQGYEDRIVAGGHACLAHARLVQLELSLQPLYGGQRLWMEMIDEMQHLGYSVWSVQPEFCDPRTGQLLQVNGLFVRTGTVSRVELQQ